MIAPSPRRSGKQRDPWLGLVRRPALLVAVLAAVAALNLVAGRAANGATDSPGRMWTIVPSERVGHNYQRLSGVDVISKNDAWAVGDRDTGPGGQTTPVIEHWDGVVWRAVDSPSPQAVGSGRYELQDVSATSPEDVWGVGGAFIGDGEQTLIERWNGFKWKVVPSPNPPYTFNVLLDVKALGPEDVWAVGGGYSSAGGEPLAEHWDGRVWRIVPTPGEPDRYVDEALSGISAASPDDIWAVGHSEHRWDGPLIPLVLHWDGTAWARVAVPDPWPVGGQLTGVAAVSSSDVWAVGYSTTAAGAYEAITEHWDGAAWTVVPGPTPGRNSELYGVVAMSATNVWAVGDYQEQSGPFRSLVQHWTGQQWRVVPSNPTQSQPYYALLSDIDAFGPGELWAVGRYLVGLSEYTLVERYGIPFCADGVDNDGDGAADYPGDPGCESSTDGSEFLGTACDNGYDDDRDGVADYPQDPGCSGIEDRDEHGTIQCDDGQDNDGDGKIDYRADGRGDPECTSLLDDNESA